MAKKSTVDRSQEYQNWLCKEELFHEAQHKSDLDKLAQDWRDNNSKAEHDMLCRLPRYITRDRAYTMWTRSAFGQTKEAALDDGARFLHEYTTDVQQVFSRVQHHHHRWDDADKKWYPLHSCLRKGTKEECKHSFPKSKQITTESNSCAKAWRETTVFESLVAETGLAPV